MSSAAFAAFLLQCEMVKLMTVNEDTAVLWGHTLHDWNSCIIYGILPVSHTRLNVESHSIGKFALGIVFPNNKQDTLLPSTKIRKWTPVSVHKVRLSSVSRSAWTCEITSSAHPSFVVICQSSFSVGMCSNCVCYIHHLSIPLPI